MYDSVGLSSTRSPWAPDVSVLLTLIVRVTSAGLYWNGTSVGTSPMFGSEKEISIPRINISSVFLSRCSA